MRSSQSYTEYNAYSEDYNFNFKFLGKLELELETRDQRGFGFGSVAFVPYRTVSYVWVHTSKLR